MRTKVEYRSTSSDRYRVAIEYDAREAQSMRYYARLEGKVGIPLTKCGGFGPTPEAAIQELVSKFRHFAELADEAMKVPA